jgi:hypothetical protein
MFGGMRERFDSISPLTNLHPQYDPLIDNQTLPTSVTYS